MTLSVDDLERLERILDIVVAMHDLFGISLEEAAGRFDQYAHENMGVVTDWTFFHARIEVQPYWVYYGIEKWAEISQAPVLGLSPVERERNGYTPLMPKLFP